jgi:glyoxylase-like metal-dependent hydrolase (beta-lactamase superfamily II)
MNAATTQHLGADVVAPEFTQLSPTLYWWSVYDSKCKCEFSSVAYQNRSSLVFVDPIRLEKGALQTLARLGKPALIALTGGTQLRAAAWYRQQFKIPLAVTPDARGELKPARADVFILPHEEVHGLKPIFIPGASVGETAYLTADGVLILGKAVVNAGEKGLQLLPDKYCVNVKQNRESLNKLLELDFHTLAFAHGQPIKVRAKERLAQLLKKA